MAAPESLLRLRAFKARQIELIKSLTHIVDDDALARPFSPTQSMSLVIRPAVIRSRPVACLRVQKCKMKR